MSLFQNTVVAKYLKGQNSETITTKWNAYKDHFQNPDIQENIRNSKEEQYQGGFIIDLFVTILGYIKNPTPNFNITTEYKNVKDSKKADAAIIIDDVVRAVVELKGTNTTDLTKVEVQAFGYKNNQPECTYVITSNFEKLRFYIDNAIEHIEFNLFTLTEEDFKLLYLCLAYENIEKDIPKKIKKESVSEEDAITKKLYKDYSLFRRELHHSLVELNPQFDALTLFKKTQKLLDRFLFLFFAEDRHLLPPNSVRLILKQWEKLKELDAYTPLFDRFKKYFGYLNTGFKGKHYDVYAYNGGLFKADEILDTIAIDDDLLYKHTLTLSEYDFNSEVDVNILGHIFENSLTEIEEIQAKIEGHEKEKTTSKRKKDGVFYTPKYITKYIVENTVGKLCEEKKVSLKVNEDDYTLDKKRQKKTRKALLDKLTEYRNWLLQLTICDPACGSGAFLNQALDFLITEHSYIDELQAKLFGDAMVLSDVEKSILENNLFGVDINQESVEIAKLSLWLRTAQPNRKLNDLSNNIKCGNSLIDDSEVAGEKAFNWQEEFPQIFAKGGFDVVIGNPPYVRNEVISENDKNYFEKNYSVFTGKSDLYVFFFEKAHSILKPNGKSSFIVSSKFTKTKYGKVLIEFLDKHTHIISFIDFQDSDVFKGIVAYPSIIFFNKTEIIPNKAQSELLVVTNENYNEFESKSCNLLKTEQSSLFQRLGSWNNGASNEELFNLHKLLEGKHPKLSDIIQKPQVGIKTGSNSSYIFPKNGVPKTINKSLLLKPYVVGREVKRYATIESQNLILLPYFNSEEKLKLIKNKNGYENEFEYLNSKREILSKRAIIDKGIINGSKSWYEFQQIKVDFPFSSEYIIYPDISSDVNFTLVENVLMDMTCFGIPSNSKSLLGILNSNLIKGYLDSICVKARGGYLRLKSQYILQIPIPKKYCNEELDKLIDLMLQIQSKTQLISIKFQTYLLSQFSIENLSKKLQKWYELEFSDFIKELNKAIKKVGGEKLTKTDEMDWMDVFETKKAEAQALKAEIDKKDKEIDQMVYELYGLNDKEIKIIENN